VDSAFFHDTRPGYLAYIPGGGLFPAALADLIADTTNRFTGIWHAAPALVQLEANVLDWFRTWMGFPPSTRGLLTTGSDPSTHTIEEAERPHDWQAIGVGRHAKGSLRDRSTQG